MWFLKIDSKTKVLHIIESRGPLLFYRVYLLPPESLCRDSMSVIIRVFLLRHRNRQNGERMNKSSVEAMMFWDNFSFRFE